MEKITQISGKVIPLAMDNVDTDLIIPAQFLTGVTREGYGKNLFIRLRQSDPDFAFNQPQFAGASILVTKDNFGCGSSREHAVWALQEAGIRAVIAESFADIFRGNSAKNGLILLTQPKDVIAKMLQEAQQGNYELTIDIQPQKIRSNQDEEFAFDMDPFSKYCFMNGLDDLNYLLQHREEIDRYFKKGD
ncbi:MAG TPA: 3-isopropylmalate dehydratase small subunit [Gammaproteobacteria bacterium]|nr:3-isopropylmalate dehydratase small subunit [Gammaproteobacteria bacterium]